jgi:hypothetical protein
LIEMVLNNIPCTHETSKKFVQFEEIYETINNKSPKAALVILPSPLGFSKAFPQRMQCSISLYIVFATICLKYLFYLFFTLEFLLFALECPFSSSLQYLPFPSKLFSSHFFFSFLCFRLHCCYE